MEEEAEADVNRSTVCTSEQSHLSNVSSSSRPCGTGKMFTLIASSRELRERVDIPD
jgi:hypothetical protein